MAMSTLKIRDLTLEPGKPKIAVPIVSADPKDIIAECESVKSMPCDMIEWRADGYLGAMEDPEGAMGEKDFYLDLIKILDDINYIAAGTPLIFTIRSKDQGGGVELTDEHLASIRGLVAQSGLVDLVDVEFSGKDAAGEKEIVTRQIDEIHKHSCRVVLSHHDFDGMPRAEEIVETVRSMAALDGDMFKFAAMAATKEDSEKLLKATAFLSRNGIGPLIMIAMGEMGKPARVAAGRYGSCVTFASGKEASAPGQVDVYTMKKWLDDYYDGKES